MKEWILTFKINTYDRESWHNVQSKKNVTKTIETNPIIRTSQLKYTLPVKTKKNKGKDKTKQKKKLRKPSP